LSENAKSGQSRVGITDSKRAYTRGQCPLYEFADEVVRGAVLLVYCRRLPNDASGGQIAHIGSNASDGVRHTYHVALRRTDTARSPGNGAITVNPGLLDPGVPADSAKRTSAVLRLIKGAQIQAWDAWAARHLQDGDLVFMRSENGMVLGVIDFSKLTQEITASPFVHIGIFAIEDGQPVVYDTDRTGPGRTSFGVMMADVSGVAIKRLRPEYQR